MKQAVAQQQQANPAVSVPATSSSAPSASTAAQASAITPMDEEPTPGGASSPGPAVAGQEGLSQVPGGRSREEDVAEDGHESKRAKTINGLFVSLDSGISVCLDVDVCNHVKQFGTPMDQTVVSAIQAEFYDTQLDEIVCALAEVENWQPDLTP